MSPCMVPSNERQVGSTPVLMWNFRLARLYFDFPWLTSVRKYYHYWRFVGDLYMSHWRPTEN